MDYSKLSDFEIDQLVTVNEYNLERWEFNEQGGFFYHCGPDGSGYAEQPVLKFCSDWSIAGLLIVNHKISLLEDGGEWEASIDYPCDIGAYGTTEICSKVYDDKNPLRAAMIVYLMMQEQ